MKFNTNRNNLKTLLESFSIRSSTFKSIIKIRDFPFTNEKNNFKNCLNINT